MFLVYTINKIYIFYENYYEQWCITFIASVKWRSVEEFDFNMSKIHHWYHMYMIKEAAQFSYQISLFKNVAWEILHFRFLFLLFFCWVLLHFVVCFFYYMFWLLPCLWELSTEEKKNIETCNEQKGGISWLLF